MIDRRRDDDAISKTWRFDRRVSLDTIVAIVGVAIVLGGPLFYWAHNMEDRVQRLELLQMEGDKQDATRNESDREFQKATVDRLEKIETKVTELQINVGRLVAPVTIAPRK